MEKLVYIDGDILPYQIGFATQRTIYMVESEGAHTCPLLVTRSKRQVNKYLKMDPDLLVSEVFLVEEPMQALATMKIHITNIVKGSKCDRFKVVLSGDTNFRNDIATIQPYKENRTDFVKPVHFDFLRNWLKERPYTIVTDNEEADDVISRAMIDGHVGATIDKDLDNTPGLHYNFNKGELYEVDEETATRNFYTQTLTGDTADNIPGIKGIGPVKAANILRGLSARDMEAAVLEQYAKVYDDPVQALREVGQLLWMRRREGEMWEPSVQAEI